MNETKKANEAIKIENFVVGDMECNAYILYSTITKKCFIIDPGADAQLFSAFIREKQLKPEGMLLTHGHIDHCGAVESLKKEFKIPVMMHRDDLPTLNSETNRTLAADHGLTIPGKPDRFLRPGEEIVTEGISLEVLYTPGHTPGSICLKCGKILFSGDTLFDGDIGRTDLEGGNFNILQASLQRLSKLPLDTDIFPGYGDSTTMSREKRLNPYL